MKKIVLIAISAMLLWSCGSTSSSTEAENDSAPPLERVVKSEAIVYKDSTTQQIYQSYQSVKDALVSDDFNAAKAQNTALITALMNKKGCETTASVAEKMKEATDIKAFRRLFTMLNVELVPFFKHQALVSGKVYEQYCPMANNGEGANWISNANQVRNPYYGAEMLDCGNVVDSLSK